MSRKQVAVKQRGVVKPSYSSDQLTVLPKPVYLWRTWAQACVALAVLLGCLVWMGAARTYALAAVGVLLVGLVQGVRGFWLEMRAAAVAKTHTQVMHTLGFPVAYQVEWTGHGMGAPSKIVVDYPHVEHSDSIDSTIAQAVNGAWAPRSFTTCRPKKTAALAGKMPAPARAVAGAVSRVAAGLRPGPVDRVVLWAYDPSAPDAEPDKTPLEVLEGRILDVSEQVFGDDAKVVDISTEGDQVTDFVVEHSYGPRLVDERVQIVLSNAVSQMIKGQWGARYDLEEDKAYFHWRRPLPRMVPRPVNPDLPSDTMIALGQNEEGGYAVWDFDGLFAHMLIAGRTRTGKTVLLRGVLMTACQQGHRVFVIDPKRIEFVALREWPNVQMVASRVEDQLALLIYLREEMMERYRLIEEEGWTETQFERIVLVIDEYKQFVANVQSWWRQNKVSGMPAQCPIIDYVGDLLRLAAAARIHVVEGTQRPDADTVGGEALAIDTPIATPRGWSTMGELEVGDEVFGPDGKPVRVVAATEVMHEHDCYRVRFSDGSTLVADAAHLWQVSTSSQRAHASRRPRPRSLRWPHQARLARRLFALSASQLDEVVTISQFERMVNDGAGIDLLHRKITEGCWDLAVAHPPVPVRGRSYRAGDLVEHLMAELTSPAPSGAVHEQVVTTRDLAEGLRRNPEIGWAIPVAGDIDYPFADLPIDPWLLGYWLGVGHKATASIATNDQVLEHIQQLGYRTPHYARYNDGVVMGERGQRHPDNLKTKLRELNLLHNKHVPAMYMTASSEQRAALLAGLLDSDGTVTVRSRTEGTASAQVQFVSTNKDLIDAVVELAASLGIIATVGMRPAGIETGANSVCLGSNRQTAWIVRFTPDRQVFGIERRQQRLACALDAPRRSTTRLRYVVAVEPVASVPVRCITVDSDDHLYLAGRTYIATHNCRDNFSARCSTGALSPDGAKMMYDNERTGVAVPKVQGRGYFAGADDRPEQVQFYWTPNPRTAKTPEDIALVDALRPTETTWQRQVWHYLSDEEVVAWQKEQAEAGRETKGSPAWLKILTATMVDYTPTTAVVEEDLTDLPDDADLGDGYDEEIMLCPSDLVEGDLILLEDGDHAGEWVSVTEVRCEGPDTVWVGWLSGDDDGLISTNDEIPVRARHLLPFDDEA